MRTLVCRVTCREFETIWWNMIEITFFFSLSPPHTLTQCMFEQFVSVHWSWYQKIEFLSRDMYAYHSGNRTKHLGFPPLLPIIPDNYVFFYYFYPKMLITTGCNWIAFCIIYSLSIFDKQKWKEALHSGVCSCMLMESFFRWGSL